MFIIPLQLRESMVNMVNDIDVSSPENLNLVTGTMAGILQKPNEISSDMQDKVLSKIDECTDSLLNNMASMGQKQLQDGVAGVASMASKTMEAGGLQADLQKENDTSLLAVKSMDKSGGNSTKVRHYNM